jgi:hypothetical protein
MARPRKPSAVLELNGAYSRNPNRKRTDEPRPDTPLSEGEPPPWINDDEQALALWDDLVAEGFWLTTADSFMLEVAVRYMTYFRNGGSEPKVISLLVGTLNKLGFGPADRSKIKAPGAKKSEEQNPFAQFK